MNGNCERGDGKVSGREWLNLVLSAAEKKSLLYLLRIVAQNDRFKSMSKEPEDPEQQLLAGITTA